ncbi:arylsulfatase [Blastopirellula sp. J2-11]|uniref:arylsulfatase n=1 Tax=Blastopirellula sp. J2-11 TaxID=2943192 RepID=UPI0021C9EB1B|nr:arylsulfatase [Blastopirellula sp. J2-11]UUO08732.1 arylsulfatase [Blastopirellula sp. J2-11]
MFAALFAQLLYATQLKAESSDLPNIIFVMADDLGYGDLGSFGQQKIATPNLDQMAREGMRLTNFYAGCTVCAPSRCVLMTGLHTGHCFIRGNARDNLRPSDVTVAEVLKEAGYQTALIGKWGLGHEGSNGVPTRQGFDYFFGYLDQGHAHNYYTTFLMRNEERVALKNVPLHEDASGKGVAKEKVEYSHDLCMNEAISFVDRAEKKDAPFFLYLSLTIPHANNQAGDAGMEVPDYGQYADKDWPEPQKGHAAMISRMDRDLGKLFAKLKQDGIDDNTLVIFTSDNGPHKEGGNDPDFANSNGPLQGIKRSLHEGGIRVPTIIRWPGHVKADSESDFAGAFWDVMPTLAAVAGVSNEVPADIDGISFLPTITGKGEQPQHDYLYWAFYEGGGAQAVRQGDWKAIQQPINSPVRLYNLQSDLGEEHDLAADQPEKVKAMTQRMAAAYTPSDRWKFPKPKAKKNNPKGAK